MGCVKSVPVSPQEKEFEKVVFNTQTAPSKETSSTLVSNDISTSVPCSSFRKSIKPLVVETQKSSLLGTAPDKIITEDHAANLNSPYGQTPRERSEAASPQTSDFFEDSPEAELVINKHGRSKTVDSHLSSKNFSFVSLPDFKKEALSSAPTSPRPEPDKIGVVETGFAGLAWDEKTNRQRLNQYLVMGNLGSGKTCRVFLVQNLKDNQYYAMKVMSKSELKKKIQFTGPGQVHFIAWENAKREVAIMKKLQHPNIATLYEVIDGDSDQIFMILEFLERGSVSSLMAQFPGRGLSELTARIYFRDLICGLDYLHQQRVVHRDIKPENLLLTGDDRLRISDFGISFVFDEESFDLLSNTAGTPLFMPPEVLSPGSFHGCLADIWSCGVTLYCFVCGYYPFHYISDHEQYASSLQSEKVVFPDEEGFEDLHLVACHSESESDFSSSDEQNETNEEPYVCHLSVECKELIRKMLKANPAERITLEEIKSDPWVTVHGDYPLPIFEFKSVPNEITKEDENNAIKRSDTHKERARTLTITVTPENQF